MHIKHKEAKEVEVNDILFLPIEYREPYGYRGNVDVIVTDTIININVKPVIIFPIRVTEVLQSGPEIIIRGFCDPTGYENYTPDTAKMLEECKTIDYKANLNGLVLYCK